MKTINQMKSIVNMQYVLEFLIEEYQSADLESERYETQAKFIDFLDRVVDINLRKVRDYMLLQEEKFEPFISILNQIDITKEQKKKEVDLSNYRKLEPSIQVKVLSFEK